MSKEDFEHLEYYRKEKRKSIEDSRISNAKIKISELGFEVFNCVDNSIWFSFKGSIVKFWPYTGWASGKTIKDGRGLKNLLKQLINTTKEE